MNHSPVLPLSGFEGSLSEYIERLWWAYTATMRRHDAWLWGRRVGPAAGREADGRDSTFWHLITDGDNNGRRLSIARAAALPSLMDLLERLGSGDPDVMWWRERQRKNRRSYWTLSVAPSDFSLRVILRSTRRQFVLVTGYPVRHPVGHRERAERSWRDGSTRPHTFKHVAWRSSVETTPGPLWAWREQLAC
jgi:hypothetical protein